jgi:hypothetical protein
MRSHGEWTLPDPHPRGDEGGFPGDGRHRRHRGAQTFRRGRAVEFLERLKIRRDTLRRQLDAPQYRDIRPVLQGELKALESVMEEYIRHFGLHESGAREDGDQPESSGG